MTACGPHGIMTVQPLGAHGRLHGAESRDDESDDVSLGSAFGRFADVLTIGAISAIAGMPGMPAMSVLIIAAPASSSPVIHVNPLPTSMSWMRSSVRANAVARR